MEASAYLQPITKTEEQGLDPQDWSELRELGHRMVDDVIDHLATVNERPVWHEMPAEVRRRFQSDLPVDGEGGRRPIGTFSNTCCPTPKAIFTRDFGRGSLGQAPVLACWPTCLPRESIPI
jgi:hypothetical protein